MTVATCTIFISSWGLGHSVSPVTFFPHSSCFSAIFLWASRVKIYALSPNVASVEFANFSVCMSDKGALEVTSDVSNAPYPSVQVV